MMTSPEFFRKHMGEILANIKSQVPDHHFEFTDPFWVLVAAMLSHRTRDEVTDSAARSLYIRYKKCEELAKASYDEVLMLIHNVGFRSVKARRIIEAARFLSEHHGCKVPPDLDSLIEIAGVGRKTANVVLADAFGIPAIAVDTHVHRISNRIGFSDSGDPAEVEKDLEEIVPRSMWVGFNPALVEFGKHVCLPRKPRCSICSIRRFCNYNRDLTS